MGEKRIILITGIVETHDFFLKQLGNAFEKMGHNTFYFDMNEKYSRTGALIKYMKEGETCLLTFNHSGIYDDEVFCDSEGRFLWDEYNVSCYNIVVDHPMYYHKFIEKHPEKYFHISIDRHHLEYVKRFYKNVKNNYFIPLGGTEIKSGHKSFEEREIPVVFTGNYYPKEHFEAFINQNGDEYRDFYMEIINYLMENPDTDVFDAMEKFIKRDIEDISEEDLKSVSSHMAFIDVYVRYALRGNVIKTLTENGIKVHVVGMGWDRLDTSCKNNLVICGCEDSAGCLDYISKSKISLNVMPWFKYGAHDRIFNTMLNGALCVTDSNTYLNEGILEDYKNCIIYRGNALEELPKKINNILKDRELMHSITENAYISAQRDTWEKRATEILKLM